uniref:Uncharacterized protein n=1 Tax=Moniliophthora roreri TaxID=221103 RepID=A0A0W0FT86_MONRR
MLSIEKYYVQWLGTLVWPTIN